MTKTKKKGKIGYPGKLTDLDIARVVAAYENRKPSTATQLSQLYGVTTASIYLLWGAIRDMERGLPPRNHSVALNYARVEKARALLATDITPLDLEQLGAVTEKTQPEAFEEIIAEAAIAEEAQQSNLDETLKEYHDMMRRWGWTEREANLAVYGVEHRA